MALLISAEDLLSGRKVESSRIEYKAGGELGVVIHTICAFANDIENVDGGYVCLGVDAADGVPIRPVRGIKKADLDNLQKKIFELCHFITPFYAPSFNVKEIDGRYVLILYVHPGSARPYQCRKIIRDKSGRTEALKDASLAYYIRHGSATVEAQADEIKELYDNSAFIPYDDRDNPDAELSDLSREMILAHLKETKSDLYPLALKMDTLSLAKSLRLIGGVKEYPMLKNIAILMFSEQTNRYFPEAYIDLLDLPDPTGRNMREKEFRGPIQLQLKEALNFIESQWLIKEYQKISGESKTKTIYNYPFNTIKELLANAVYHRDYQIREPITVVRTPNYIEIKSFPGLKHEFSDQQIKDLELQSDFPYRNRRIGNFLKELGLTEGHNTGIPTALAALKENGSNPLYYLPSPRREATIVRIPVHPSFSIDQVLTRVDRRRKMTLDELKRAILSVLATGSYSQRALMAQLGFKGKTSLLARALNELEEDQVIQTHKAGRNSYIELKK